jgi:cytochrome c-type biogenesis protein CcmH/NrfF
MSGKTLFLWLAPALLIGAGALVALRVVSGRMSLPIDDENDNDQQQAQL